MKKCTGLTFSTTHLFGDIQDQQGAAKPVMPPTETLISEISEAKNQKQDPQGFHGV